METDGGSGTNRLVSLSPTKRQGILKKYIKIHSNKVESEKYFHYLLSKSKKAVERGHINVFIKLAREIEAISHLEDPETLRIFLNNDNNPLKSTNLIILACKHLRSKILGYLFSNETNILNIFIENTFILPGDIDDSCQNAFYYAIRSGKIELLEILLKLWPKSYFANNPDALYDLLSEAYKDLKLENISLSDEIRTFVLNLLVNLRFDHTPEYQQSGSKSSDIKNNEDKFGSLLLLAVLKEHKDITNILLKENVNVNKKGDENITVLHLAAVKGDLHLVKLLLLKGAIINAVTCSGTTPLHFAVQQKNHQIVEVLIANGAETDVRCRDGTTALHRAAALGHIEVTRVLLDHKTNIHLKDSQNRTALEIAAIQGRPQIIKILCEYDCVDLNAKVDGNHTLLHIASQANRLEVVKYLTDKGCDVNARNTFGSKPIHLAASAGCTGVVDFFLKKGMSVNDLGSNNRTLIHYAALNDQVDLVEYLVSRGCDINPIDNNRLTPLDVAAVWKSQNVTKILLENGASYNGIVSSSKIPLGATNNTASKYLSERVKRLFQAVRRNCFSEVKDLILNGVPVNFKDYQGHTSLFYAAYKGYDKIVNILLDNNACPNKPNNKKITPLHCAAKFSHRGIVMSLLSHGAVYNASSSDGKTPLNFTKNQTIIDLLNTIDRLFRSVKNCGTQIIKEVGRIKDINTVKALMGAQNNKHENLVVAAILNNYPKVEELKQICQGNVSVIINEGLKMLNQNKFQEALTTFESVYQKRKEILGANNPGTLDIQTHIARTLYTQGSYSKALELFQEIGEKQEKMLGINQKDTLKTRNMIALVLHKQGKNEKALDICRIVCDKQRELLGPNHPDTLESQFHLALVLNKLGYCREALVLNSEIYKTIKSSSGENDPYAVCAQNNIALVLTNQGYYREALKIYREVFGKMSLLFGVNHIDTLRSLRNIASVLHFQNNNEQAVKLCRQLQDIQKNKFGLSHPETLETMKLLSAVLLKQLNLSVVKEDNEKILQQMLKLSHVRRCNESDSPKLVELSELDGRETREVLQHRGGDLRMAASNGHVELVQHLLQGDCDVDETDADGRTPLHYAVSNRQIAVLKVLLGNGADVTTITKKGNTVLHLACISGDEDIIVLLLVHEKIRCNNFINTKTVKTGTTALHIAAEKGHFSIVKELLKRGAVYNVRNNNGQTPFNLSTDKKVKKYFKLLNDLFRDAATGNKDIINKLKILESNEFIVVTNAHNEQDKTLFQISLVHKHGHISSILLELLIKNNGSITISDWMDV